MRWLRGIAVIAITGLLGGLACATVPKEVVELSYTLGQDLNSVHHSYRALVREHFDALRARTLEFLNERWTPTYLKDFIESGELVARAQKSDPAQVLTEVGIWVEVALEEIEEKKRMLIDPINRDEADLLEAVDEAFDRMVSANATITAHLNSLRRVQEVQDQALQALGLKDLRDRIDQGLKTASERAERALQDLEKSQSRIEDATKEKERLKEKFREPDTNERQE